MESDTAVTDTKTITTVDAETQTDDREERFVRSGSESGFARTSSSASNLPRNDSISSSGSVSGSSALAAIPEAPVHRRRRNDGNDAESIRSNDSPDELIRACEECGNPSFSERVPPFPMSKLMLQNAMDLMLTATQSHIKNLIVTNVHEKLQTGRIEEKCIFTIPSTEKHEYNLVVKVAIHESVAVSMAILKGDKDKALIWPFNKSVIFRVTNQRGKPDKTRMFRCDRNAVRFKESLSRPKSDANLPLGFPKFLSRQSLLNEGFVWNDTMCVQCIIFPKETKLALDAEMPSVFK